MRSLARKDWVVPYEGDFMRLLRRSIYVRFGAVSWLYHPQEEFKTGVPDLVGTIYGRFIALELKHDGERPANAPWHPKRHFSPLQLDALKNIEAAGGIALLPFYIESDKRYVALTLMDLEVPGGITKEMWHDWIDGRRVGRIESDGLLEVRPIVEATLAEMGTTPRPTFLVGMEPFQLSSPDLRSGR